MLKYEDKQDGPSLPAEQVHVTPEELATAVAMLESRRQGTSGTLTIGQAVEELSLEAVPGDILREVEAQREQIRKQQRTTSARRRWSFSLLFSLFCLMGFSIYSVTGSGPSIQDRMTPGTAPYNLESQILALDSKSGKPTLSTLAEAPSDQTLYCSAGAIEVAAMSRNAQMGLEPQRGISQRTADINWPIVKHGKDFYVRGWVLIPLSKEAARLTDVEVFNKPSLPQLGSHPQQVTFKLDLHTSLVGLEYQRLRPSGIGEFVFHNPRLTVHTYEKWQP